MVERGGIEWVAQVRGEGVEGVAPPGESVIDISVIASNLKFTRNTDTFNWESERWF